MAPMIDVIFLLLIFFVCTASFQPPEEILPTNLSLPGAIESAAPIDPEIEDLDEIVVKLLWAGGRVRWEINGRQYDRLGEVRGVLDAIARRVRPDVPIILEIDGSVPMEHVIDVYDLSRRAGLEKVRFAASADAVAENQGHIE